MKRWTWLLLLCACDGRPVFKEGDYDSTTVGKGLPPGFLLGTATASHQIEGGNLNDWTDWERGQFRDGRPHIKNNDHSGDAVDSWNLFDTDLAAMKAMGVNAYRFSVEWSRLEPSENEWNAAAAQRYREWVFKLRAAGIEPMVTLSHFTLPRWVAARGGWESVGTVDFFERFAERVAALLGDQVDLWCTVNEPNVVAYESYMLGEFPPGKTDNALAAQVLVRLLEGHAAAARAVRASDTFDADGDGKATMVGIAHHVRYFQPATGSPLDTAVVGLTDDFFNEAIPRAVQTGRVQLSQPGTFEIDLEVPDLKGSFDYLGVNYYTRSMVRADLSDSAMSQQYVLRGRPTNDLGWDLYPEGMYLFLKRFSRYGWPIYVLENGIADRSGQVRPGFLRDHLHAVELAAAEGVDVRGYFHWTLMDNFEWAEGWQAEFGLYRVDPNDPLKRRLTGPGVDAFQQVARNLGTLK